jgi:adenine-specific DNA-methyltransferase
MPTPLEKFQSLLRELFQFEQADLDFGVYRIMNMRRARMETWLNEDLPARVRAILSQGGTTADDELGNRLEAVKAQLLEMDPGGIDKDGTIVNDALKGVAKGKEYLKLKAQHDRAPVRTAAGMEPLVYNHLYDFFSRYYDTGDFIPKRRRSFAPDGRDTYAIPWDGEEVVLHWANKDQYYIKTGERFTHYRWQSQAGIRTFTVEFRLTDADLPANNNKDGKKKFNLLVADKVEWQEDTNTLIVPFHYRVLTPEEEGQLTGTQETKLRESIIRRTVDTLPELPSVAGVPQLVIALMAAKRDAAGEIKVDKRTNEAVPLLQHHLNRWAVKNESDFFIHKDLRRFLSGELDYFLKSVVLNLDNLLAAGEQRAEPNFRLLEAVKHLGSEIVDFVSHLEDFQKALFEKKKFVLETSWCLTLDRIPPSVKETVYAAILANDRQWEQWEDLYKISQWPSDLVTFTPRTQEFLDAYPCMMLDTAQGYDPSLIEALVSGFDNLEHQANGLIVHSENLQALNLLKKHYWEAVNCLYIDPPYNTGKDEFAYRDAYPHSSWLAYFQDRLQASSSYLVSDGVLFCSIDEKERSRLMLQLEALLGSENHVGTIVWKGATDNNPTRIAVEHEFVTCWAKNSAEVASEWKNKSDDTKELMLAEYARLKTQNRDPVWIQKQFRTWIKENDSSLQPLTHYDRIDEDGPYTGSRKVHNPGKEGYRYDVPHDVTGKPCKEPARGYRYPKTTMDGLLAAGKILFGDDESQIIQIKEYLKDYEGSLKGIIELDSRTAANALEGLFGSREVFKNPKPPELIEHLIPFVANNDSLLLDYVAGSGTSGHAVISLNREDEGSRKYALVEMGAHFDAVLKPRLQKVVFSENWRAGAPELQAKPKARNNPYNGISHCIKVLRLESYEDALDNIEFNSAAAPGAELGLDFRRDYELRYALDWESKDCPTRLAVAQLDTPFDYTLTLRRETGTVTVKPDLPETFAYLIGLHTRRRFRTERESVRYLIYTGMLHEDGTEVAVLWRTCRGWTEENLKAEMDWWRAQRETLAPGVTRVYVNGASAIEGHHSLDAEFKIRMHGANA